LVGSREGSAGAGVGVAGPQHGTSPITTPQPVVMKTKIVKAMSGRVIEFLF
jgi:hypothetical protein